MCRSLAIAVPAALCQPWSHVLWGSDWALCLCLSQPLPSHWYRSPPFPSRWVSCHLPITPSPALQKLTVRTRAPQRWAHCACFCFLPQGFVRWAWLAATLLGLSCCIRSCPCLMMWRVNSAGPSALPVSQHLCSLWQLLFSSGRLAPTERNSLSWKRIV